MTKVNIENAELFFLGFENKKCGDRLIRKKRRFIVKFRYNDSDFSGEVKEC
jgi:hypothetical protein